MARETQQIIKSLQLIISDQVRPYLSAITKGSSLTCSSVFGAAVQFGEVGPKRAKIPQIIIRETQEIIQSL